MTEEKTLREQLEDAFEEHTAPTDPADTVAEPEKEPEAKTEEVEPVAEPVAAPPTQPEIDAPQAWTAPLKEKWKDIPPDIKAEIVRRENDFHKMVTRSDGELRLGREMKEVLDPYMATIRSAGAEPKALINDLLGTVNTLKNGTEDQKIAVVRNIAEGYGVDLNKVIGYQQNPINNLYSEINSLKQTLNPDVILNKLQEQQEAVKSKLKLKPSLQTLAMSTMIKSSL